ncbi:E3 SUMO-protein ligase PIAS1-like [Salvelinus sp. IW2-2015]|uniref:E3 SUMO-protein ligase PIAS1-like n=1 Tax=Salvelinus sp. IW2-2015 TaxID=2691554 RepID=UPI000CEB1D0D|nr:E3 SUMO-protein ligase PIAS1-like [Salvelinus alpinus]
MAESAELKQMVMSLRVSELQVLLGYAGRNKHGRKHELLTKALHLLKAGCSPAVQMKVKELYRRRFPTKMVSPVDLALPSVHSTLSGGLTSLGFDSHGSPSPLSLLGPKHELGLPHLPSSLHPVHPDVKLQRLPSSLHPLHPDVKLQRLPFYDMLDELIKPTSLAQKQSGGSGDVLCSLHDTQRSADQQLHVLFIRDELYPGGSFRPTCVFKVNSKPCNLRANFFGNNWRVVLWVSHR